MRFAPAMPLAFCSAWRNDTSSWCATTMSAPLHGQAMLRAKAASAANRAMAADLIAQTERVVDGECRIVVVEIDVDRVHFAFPRPDALRPRLELLVAVAPLVLVPRRAVQAHVGPRRGDLDRRLVAGQLVDAERRVVLAQHVVHGVSHPRRVAQLECVADAARQLVEEMVEPPRGIPYALDRKTPS